MREDTIEAVICDLDGTLVYTIEDIASAANRVLERYGYPQHEAAEYKQYVGNGLARILPVLMEASGHQVEEEQLALMSEELIEAYREEPCSFTRPYPGIMEFLTYLSDHRIPVSILSNKSEIITTEVVRQVFGEFPFVSVLGENKRFPRKPDPASALHQAELMGAPPGSTLFFGDSEVDYQTAAAARMVPRIASWGYRTSEYLLREVPREYLISQIGQIYDTITGE